MPISARTALALALRHAGIGAGDDVLVPAYHCISIVKPVLWASARPVFYRVQPDLSVDLGDLSARLSPRTRALLIIHYFGFPQDTKALRDFCDARRLVLIEDCAHAFFGECAGGAIGALGDYAIASAPKFFAVPDGGYLVSSRHTVTGLELRSLGARYQMKAVTTSLEWALQHGRLRAMRPVIALPLRAKNFLWGLLKHGLKTTTASAPGMQGSERSDEFDPNLVHKRMSAWSRLVVHAADRRRIVENRRSHFLRLRDGLVDASGCHALLPALPAGVVPYVFPLIVDDPERLFPNLKRRGVPIVRFGQYLYDGAERICPVAADYARRLFQLPCHQELTPAEIDWMIATIRETTGSTATGHVAGLALRQGQRRP